MQMKALQAVLIAAAVSGCASYSITSVRPTYSDPRVEISCAVFPNDRAELNKSLADLYKEGWRLAASGSKTAVFSSPEPFLCLERPAEAPKPKVKAKPPPPVEEEEEVIEEEAPSKAAPPPAAAAPAPAKKTVKKAPVEEPPAEEEAPPPPVKKKRKPVLDE